MNPSKRKLLVLLGAAAIMFLLALITTESAARGADISNSSDTPTGVYLNGGYIISTSEDKTPSVHPVKPQSVQIPLTDVQNYAYRRVCEIWGCEQWNYFYDLVYRESGWKPWAQNRTSSAYGLMQFLDYSWAGTGYTKTSDPYQQLEAGFVYIQNRYDTPYRAILFHNRMNYY